jgi:hypothetical protein
MAGIAAADAVVIRVPHRWRRRRSRKPPIRRRPVAAKRGFQAPEAAAAQGGNGSCKSGVAFAVHSISPATQADGPDDGLPRVRCRPEFLQAPAQGQAGVDAGLLHATLRRRPGAQIVEHLVQRQVAPDLEIRRLDVGAGKGHAAVAEVDPAPFGRPVGADRVGRVVPDDFRQCRVAVQQRVSPGGEQAARLEHPPHFGEKGFVAEPVQGLGDRDQVAAVIAQAADFGRRLPVVDAGMGLGLGQLLGRKIRGMRTV